MPLLKIEPKSFYKTKKVINLMTFSIRKSTRGFRSRTISWLLFFIIPFLPWNRKENDVNLSPYQTHRQQRIWPCPCAERSLGSSYFRWRYGKVKLGVKKLILSFLHPCFKSNLFYKFISGAFHTCGCPWWFLHDRCAFFDKLIQVLWAHDFHGQSTSCKILMRRAAKISCTNYSIKNEGC